MLVVVKNRIVFQIIPATQNASDLGERESKEQSKGLRIRRKNEDFKTAQIVLCDCGANLPELGIYTS